MSKKQQSTPVRKVKANSSITPAQAREKAITELMPLRDIEKFGVLLDRRRGMTIATICKKWKLSLGAVKHIVYHHKLEDFAITAEDIERYMLGLNARMVLLQNDVLESVTAKDIRDTSFTQRMVALGILADKTKQYDAHIAGSEEHKSKSVDWRDKDELIRRIKRLQRESPSLRALEAEDAVVLDDNEAGSGIEDGSGSADLPGQGNLFPPESVEEHAKAAGEAAATKRSSNDRLGVSPITLRPRNGTA